MSYRIYLSLLSLGLMLIIYLEVAKHRGASLSIKIPIHLDVADLMGHIAYCSQWLHTVGAGSSPGVALFADVAVQGLI